MSESHAELTATQQAAAAAQLLTPKGRKVICERLASTRKAAYTFALAEGREPYPEVTYTTDGETIFADGKPMFDEQAFDALQQTSILMGKYF